MFRSCTPTEDKACIPQKIAFSDLQADCLPDGTETGCVLELTDEQYERLEKKRQRECARGKGVRFPLKKGYADPVIFQWENAWYLLATNEKTDNIWSMYALGNIYSSEKYNCKDIELAVKWYKQAEKNGNEYISYKLGKIYLNEQSQYYSLDKGIEHMQKAYEKGNMMAAYQLGKIYADKSKECYDLEKAIDYYKEAAENENALAAYQLGKIYLNENNGKQNIQEAIYYLKLAAKKDSQFATYQLGKVYYDEKYGLKNDTKAFHWFEKSAKEGNNRATYQMAKIDYEKQNYTNAAKLFQKVDDVYSHYYLGKIYLDESKGNPLYNPKKGLMYLKQASSEGNTFASMAIGLSYLRGEGVKRDVKTAKDWLNLASGQGNEYASEILKKINFFRKTLAK